MQTVFLLFVVGAVGATITVTTETPWNETTEQALLLTTESPSGPVCRTSRACRKRTGFCMPSSETCSGRVINNKGCGPDCTCCAMEPTKCRVRRSCREANGTCIISSGSCTGFFLENGCTGSGGCMCCVNGTHTSPFTTSIRTTISVTTTFGDSTTAASITRDTTTRATTKTVTLNTRASTTFEYSTNNYIGCPNGYSEVAGGCYLFNKLHGSPRKSWSDARSFCQSLSTGDYYVDLVILKYFSTLQDNPVLSFMNEQGMWYTWFGAKFSHSDRTWSWLDGRTFTSNSSMWSLGQPNDEDNSNRDPSICSAFGRNTLPYFSMFDIPCSWTRDYACQIYACPVGYSEVAGKCYFFSKLYDLPRRSWSEARSYCQSMSNEDYSVDLIVLENFTTLLDDPVLNYIYSQGMWYTWFGATFSPSPNTWSWLDGRTFTSNSTMWSPGQPNDEGNSNCAAFGSYNLSYFSMFDVPCSWTRDYACQIHALT